MKQDSAPSLFAANEKRLTEVVDMAEKNEQVGNSGRENLCGHHGSCAANREAETHGHRHDPLVAMKQHERPLLQHHHGRSCATSEGNSYLQGKRERTDGEAEVGERKQDDRQREPPLAPGHDVTFVGELSRI